MTYYIGDIPGEDLVIEPARGQDLLTLDDYTAGDTEVELRDPNGELVLADFTPTFDEDLVLLEWPTTSVLDNAGTWTLHITLVGPTARARLRPVYLVVQDPSDGWYTVDDARDDWPDAPASDARVAQLLDLAKLQVLDFAPALPVAAPPPVNYRAGQLQQARNIWNAGRANPSTGDFGQDGFTLTVHPLDWHVEQLLRPKKGVPNVG